MTYFSLFARVAMPVYILATLSSSVAGATAREDGSHSLRHTEQSAVVVADSVQDDGEAGEPQVEVAETMLVGSMGSMLQSEAEVMDPKSPKAALQRQLVALIWLERVLEQNLNTMDSKAFLKQVAKSKTGLEKDSTPATADMLAKMRTEMHEFSVPFFKDAVQSELSDIRARQKVLLDKIIAIDSGEPVVLEEKEEPVVLDEKEDEAKKDEKKTPTAPKKQKAPPKKAKGGEKPDEKKRRNKQSNVFVFVMSLFGATLILFVLGVAIKVHTHVPRGG